MSKKNNEHSLGRLIAFALLVAVAVVLANNPKVLEAAGNNAGQGLLESIMGISDKKNKPPPKAEADKPPELTFESTCTGKRHGPGCVAAKYVRQGQIQLPDSDDQDDFKIAIGAKAKPATQYTNDAGNVQYYTVNKPVWISLVRMANSLDSTKCHMRKLKNKKKKRVCKTWQGAISVSCLEFCHDYYARPGVASDHVFGEAVDVAKFRWRGKWYAIYGHQYSHKAQMRRITVACLRAGAHQAISLLDFGYGSRSFAMSNHDDHLHCGGYY